MSELNPCWIGKCAGCGRTLVSATWPIGRKDTRAAADLGYRKDRPVFCTRRCRALHEHDVTPWGSTVRERLRRETAR